MLAVYGKPGENESEETGALNAIDNSWRRRPFATPMRVRAGYDSVGSQLTLGNFRCALEISTIGVLFTMPKGHRAM